MPTCYLFKPLLIIVLLLSSFGCKTLGLPPSENEVSSSSRIIARRDATISLGALGESSPARRQKHRKLLKRGGKGGRKRPEYIDDTATSRLHRPAEKRTRTERPDQEEPEFWWFRIIGKDRNEHLVYQLHKDGSRWRALQGWMPKLSSQFHPDTKRELDVKRHELIRHGDDVSALPEHLLRWHRLTRTEGERRYNQFPLFAPGQDPRPDRLATLGERMHTMDSIRQEEGLGHEEKASAMDVFSLRKVTWTTWPT